MTAPAIHKVNSLTLPELEPYRTLRRPLDHIRRGIFVAEGEKVVRRLLASDLTVVSILLTPEWHEQIFPNKNQGGTHLYQRVENVPVFVAEKKLLESIVGFNLHQGIMAVAKVPEARPLEEVVSHLKSPHLLVALEGLVSAENVGVVVRNCAALGVDAIIVGETSSSPYLRRAVRNSMGAVFRMPVVHVQNLASTLGSLRQRSHFEVIGAHPAVDAKSIYDCDLTTNICIVLGNEGD